MPLRRAREGRREVLMLCVTACILLLREFTRRQAARTGAVPVTTAIKKKQMTVSQSMLIQQLSKSESYARAANRNATKSCRTLALEQIHSPDTTGSGCRNVLPRRRIQLGMCDEMSNNVDVPSAAGPLALPWRLASLSAYDVSVTGLAPNPLKVNGARAVLSASGACGLIIDGFKTTYRSRGTRLCLDTRDVLGAKVCCPLVAGRSCRLPYLSLRHFNCEDFLLLLGLRICILSLGGSPVRIQNGIALQDQRHRPEGRFALPFTSLQLLLV
jgi:hypothetical protein